jgi:hypothetical protein
MAGDNDPVADEPSPDDIAERDDAADETKAANEADLVDVDVDEAADGDDAEKVPTEQGARLSWSRLLVVVPPALALMLALGVGYLKWPDGTARESQRAADQSVRAASESTLAMTAGRNVRRSGREHPLARIQHSCARASSRIRSRRSPHPM